MEHAPADLPGSPSHARGRLPGYKGVGCYFGEGEWARGQLHDNITKRLGNVVYMPDRCKELLQVSPSVRNEDQTLWLMDMLKGHRFFSKLEPSVVKELCKQLELRTLTKGDVLFQQGAEGKVFYIILSGQISLHSTITSDRDVPPPRAENGRRRVSEPRRRGPARGPEVDRCTRHRLR